MDNFLYASLKVNHISTVLIKMIKFEINRINNQTEFNLHSPFHKVISKFNKNSFLIFI